MKLVWVLVFVVVIIFGGVSYLRYAQQSQECLDCGDGGWQKMSEECGRQVTTKNEYKNCLINFDWSSVSSYTSTGEMYEGYIELGGTGMSKHPAANSIKVIIFNQWAVDNSGSLYLLGQLG